MLYQTTAQHRADENRLHGHHHDRLISLTELIDFDAISVFFITCLTILRKDRTQLVATVISNTQIPAINNISVAEWGAFEEETLSTDIFTGSDVIYENKPWNRTQIWSREPLLLNASNNKQTMLKFSYFSTS